MKFLPPPYLFYLLSILVLSIQGSNNQDRNLSESSNEKNTPSPKDIIKEASKDSDALSFTDASVIDAQLIESLSEKDRKQMIKQLMTNEAFLKLDPEKVKTWDPFMRRDFLNAFSGKNVSVLINSPVFAALLQGFPLWIIWKLNWDYDDIKNDIDKIPAEFLRDAVIAYAKYRIIEIVGKIKPKEVKTWAPGEIVDFMNVFRGEEVTVLLNSPVSSVLLEHWWVKANWKPHWEYKDIKNDIENNLNEIPVDFLGKFVIAFKECHTKEVLERLNSEAVNEWCLNMTKKFLNAFRGEEVTVLLNSSVFVILLRKLWTKRDWKPLWEYKDIEKDIDRIPIDFIYNAIVAFKECRTEAILRRLTCDEVKKWRDDMKKNFLCALEASFDNLPIPLQVFLSPEWLDIEKEWVPKWTIQEMAKNMDKLPSECVGRAIIADYRYLTREILKKLDPAEVKKWNDDIKKKFLGKFEKTFDNLPIPLQVVLSAEWIEMEYGKTWFPKFGVSHFIKHWEEFPLRLIAWAFFANKKYRTMEVTGKLTADIVKEWTKEEKQLLQSELGSGLINAMKNEAVKEFWKK